MCLWIHRIFFYELEFYQVGLTLPLNGPLRIVFLVTCALGCSSKDNLALPVVFTCNSTI